jgi:hypothetical protein
MIYILYEMQIYEFKTMNDVSEYFKYDGVFIKNTNNLCVINSRNEKKYIDLSFEFIRFL